MSLQHDDFIKASMSPKPSFITLPRQDQPLPLLLDFFAQRFPRIEREIWLERLRSGKISDDKGQLIDEFTPYRINARLRYYREVKNEAIVPFQESIIYEDEQILVADKPHFLPVTPNGNAVNECLMHRLVKRTGNHQLVPVHRLDRETAGLVLFSKQPATRKHYHAMFQQGKIDKQYEAVGTLPSQSNRSAWLIESRIEASGEWTLHHNVAGEVNARSSIKLLEKSDELARFSLSPLTGKTHQLRLHMGLIGSQILHDTFYPHLLPESDQRDYSRPLQLLAKKLVFTDPVSSVKHQFESGQLLSSWSSM